MQSIISIRKFLLNKAICLPQGTFASLNNVWPTENIFEKSRKCSFYSTVLITGKAAILLLISHTHIYTRALTYTHAHTHTHSHEPLEGYD